MQLKALRAGVDVIAAETLPVVGEAVVLAALVQELGAKLLDAQQREKVRVALGSISVNSKK